MFKVKKYFFSLLNNTCCSPISEQTDSVQQMSIDLPKDQISGCKRFIYLKQVDLTRLLLVLEQLNVVLAWAVNH